MKTGPLSLLTKVIKSMDAMDNEALMHTVCPQITDLKELEVLLQNNYGLEIKQVKALNGYDDSNFHVQVNEDHCNKHIEQVCPHGYMLKVINAVDSKSEDFNMGQKMVMDHLNSHGVKCQKQVKTVDGNNFSSITLNQDGKPVTNRVALRTFLPGTILANVRLTSSLAYDLGLLTAKIDKSLQDFEFPFYSDFAPLWNMDNFMKVKSVAHAVKDEKQRKVIMEVFTAFETEFLPRRHEFKKGQIHGDINEQNILVEQTPSGAKICGVLDLQDTAYSCIIYDVALAISYMMMLPNLDVPLEDIGGHILAAYQTVFPLTALERGSLRLLAASRMVMSLVYGAYKHMLDPSNDYLLETSKAGWDNLFLLWEKSDEMVWEKWDKVIQSYAS